MLHFFRTTIYNRISGGLLLNSRRFEKTFYISLLNLTDRNRKDINLFIILIIKYFTRKKINLIFKLVDEKLYIFLHTKNKLYIQLIIELLIISSKLLQLTTWKDRFLFNFVKLLCWWIRNLSTVWRETKQYYIMTDGLPSQNLFNKPSFPTISDYDDFEQNTFGHITLETNLYVCALLLSSA